MKALVDKWAARGEGSQFKAYADKIKKYNDDKEKDK